MNLALILFYAYIGIFAFLVYYGVAWIYVKVGKYILDYLVFPAFFPLVFLNWRYMKKNSEFNSNQNHIAIVMCNNYMPERVIAYKEDIPKLIKYFKKNGWAYKIYFKADKKELREVVNDPKATIIYLLGHGERHGIKVNKNEVVYYCEFEKSPKKKFIAQMHCNHYGGKSLAEYVSENSIKSFVTNKKLNGWQLNNFIDKVVKGGIHGAP